MALVTQVEPKQESRCSDSYGGIGMEPNCLHGSYGVYMELGSSSREDTGMGKKVRRCFVCFLELCSNSYCWHWHGSERRQCLLELLHSLFQQHILTDHIFPLTATSIEQTMSKLRSD